MKKKLTVMLLACMLAMQTASASFAAADTATDLIIHTLTLPFRLTTGALTGTYGLVTGGFQGAYDMSADANERIVDAGTTPAQVLVWPFTIPAGFIKGGVTGFADKFVDGYSYWDEWTK